MGCLKLTYNQQGTPLKVVYRKTEPQQKGVQGFLSVDPMADQRSWVSPYSYCQNSPIIRTDPTGALDDWFMNEKTGDVYYNSEMRKGDEGTGAMTGEGWVHMGENGMFSDGTPQTSDVAVLYQNASLTSGGVKSTPVYKDAPIPTKEATEVVGYKFQATFKGKNAETFMSGKGYDKKPLVANVHTYERSWCISEPHGPVWQNESWESFESVSAWRYIPKGVKGNYTITGYYGKRILNETNISTNSYTRQTWETRRYDYSKSPTWKPGVWEQLFFEVLKNIHDLK